MASEIQDSALAEKLFGKPLTRAGWWAVGLALGLLALFVVMCIWGGRASNPHGGFWADPLGAFLVISTAACGIAAGLASGIGIILKRERSLLLFLILAVGALVLCFAVGELLEGFGRH